ncbi:carbohydrate-binding module family 19 [Melampsora larici-populina 98AG31]|uniref:Carbohydrate-binding module family 19 n=1 Tax=Melampsora larici-populina (strain 98AG31 / pathotype 3-4-7) TaxID=747676 RepID=F4R4G7_MELLP|nr:carbohydrate-binding module family 19 [Melampsora larici-populina 98AG31]EGG12807.1 carbohydrate-binding module family 19 [Melampsora larici-populina 98AG31]
MHTMNSFVFVAALLVNRVVTYPSSLDSVLVPANAQELQRRAITPDVLLNNGKLAQGLNAKYATMTMETSCKEGDHACVQGGFAQCVVGKYVSLGCAPPTVCFELPLLLKPGSVPGCTTPADAAARIANTGVQGGVKGDGTDTPAGSNTTSPVADAPSLNGTDMGMADMTGDAMSMNTSSDATPDLNATSTANTTASAIPSDSAKANDTLTVDVSNNSTTPSSNATAPTSANANATVSAPTVADNSTAPLAAADAQPVISSNSDEDCVDE